MVEHAGPLVLGVFVFSPYATLPGLILLSKPHSCNEPTLFYGGSRLTSALTPKASVCCILTVDVAPRLGGHHDAVAEHHAG